VQKTIDYRKCDHCGKEVQRSEIMYGGDVFSGWLTIETVRGFGLQQDNPVLDFCSDKCAVEFLSKRIGIKKSNE